jgi:hypothetical protein
VGCHARILHYKGRVIPIRKRSDQIADFHERLRLEVFIFLELVDQADLFIKPVICEFSSKEEG